MDPANLISMTIFLGVAAMTGFVYQVSNLLGGAKNIVGAPIRVVDNVSDAFGAKNIIQNITEGASTGLDATHSELTAVGNATVAAPAALPNTIKTARNSVEDMAGNSLETAGNFLHKFLFV